MKPTPAEIDRGCPGAQRHDAAGQGQWNTAEDCDCIARRPICGVEQPKDEQQRNRNNHAKRRPAEMSCSKLPP